jgi:surface antigen
MATYKPRTTPPGVFDDFWVGVDYGSGLNECIVIDKHTGSVLPNCTGYAWGRFFEIMQRRPSLSRGNAKDWFYYRDGYSRGQVPAVGAVACWGAIPGYKYGHVAVVEAIGPGYMMVSQSNYGGKRFEYVKSVRMENGKYKSPAGNYNFLGFIYNPVRFDASGSSGPAQVYKTVDEIARAIIRGTGVWYHCYGEDRRKKIESYGFNPDEVQHRINEMIRNGDY